MQKLLPPTLITDELDAKHPVGIEEPTDISDAPLTTDVADGLAGDLLYGIKAISAYLDKTPRQVRYARETGALPIRHKPGRGLYAFKSELLAAMKDNDSLPPTSPG